MVDTVISLILVVFGMVLAIYSIEETRITRIVIAASTALILMSLAYAHVGLIEAAILQFAMAIGIFLIAALTSPMLYLRKEKTRKIVGAMLLLPVTVVLIGPLLYHLTPKPIIYLPTRIDPVLFYILLPHGALLLVTALATTILIRKRE